MDTTRYIPTVLAYCAGYGGIERGLDLAGVEHRVVAYVEIEAFAIANLVNKMESGELAHAPVYTDIKTFPAHLFRGAVDILTGGYPCQPFSAAGLRLGKDDPRHLWPFIDHHIGIIDPGRVFFENVEGHISLGLSTVVADLEERGYDTTWGIFSAAEVGAPHQRKRVYIMGDAKRTGLAQRPEYAGVRGTAQRPPTREILGVHHNEWHSPGSWEAEPGVARMAHGVADVVDRIRLLGNGVVPQCAAKAWQVLDEELANDQY